MKIRIALGLTAAALAVLSAGCSCGDPAAAGNCTAGTVAIDSPPDSSSTGQKVTEDGSAATPGVQVTLQATATGVPDGTEFIVTVNGTALETPVVLQGGLLTLGDLTLANGNNSLAISATQCDSPVSDTITVVVEIPVAGTCAFTDPTDGQALGAANDLDRAAGGLQYDVEASCTDATPGGSASLLVNGVEVATSTFGNTGVVVFSGATLPEGAVVLGLSSSAGTDEIDVTVDLTVPDILLGLPIDVGLADDLDGDASNGLQATARVEGSALADGDAVEVDCGGGVVASGVIAGGFALLELSFSPDDCLGVDFGCVARSAALPGVTSNLATIHADDEAPVIVLTAPNPEDLACSVTPLVAAGVSCLEPGLRVALLKLEPNDAHTPIADAVEPVGAVATWPAGAIYPGALAEGGYTLILETEDGSGNAAQLIWATVVDVTAPAPAFRTPIQDQRYVQADDADGNAANGFQHDVVVDLPGERDGVAVTVVARSGGVDVAGPYAGVVDTGAVTFTALDLPADRFTLVVSVDDGCSPVATASVDVFVDNGQAQCNLLVPANGLVTGSPTLLVDVQTTVPAGVPIVIDGLDPAGQPVTFGSFPAGAGASTAGSVLLVSGDGGYVVAAHCGVATSPSKQVELDSGAPVLTVTLPASVGTFINQSAFDMDPVQPGFQVDVVVTADSIQDGSAGTVDVSCSDGSSASQPLAFVGASATAALTVSDGESCTFTANAADAAGNAATPVSVVRAIDLAAPGVGPCTPLPGSTAIAPITVTCAVAGGTTGDAIELQEAGLPIFGGTLGAVPTTFTTTVLPLTTGGHVLSIRVTDAAGNVAPVSLTFDAFNDDGAATCVLVTPVDGLVTGSASVAFDLTTDVPAGFSVSIEAVDPAGLPVTLGTFAASPGGSTQGVVALGGGDGLYTIAAHCGVSISASSRVEYDTAAPILAVAVSGMVGPWINASAADADPASPGFQVAVVVTADSIQDGSSGTLAVTCTDGTNGSVPFTFTGNVATVFAVAPDGASCTYTADATDGGGNIAAAAAATVAVDRTAPAVGPCTPSGGQVVGLPVTFNCAVAGGAAGDPVELLEGAAQLEADVLGAVPTSWSSSALVLPAGAHLVTVRVTDVAGNVVPVNLVFSVNVVPPTIAIVSPPSGTVRSRLGDLNPATPDVDVQFQVQVTGANPGDAFWICSGLGTGPACPGGVGLRVDSQVTTVAGPMTNATLAFVDGVHDLYACIDNGLAPVVCSAGGHILTVDSVPPVVTALELVDDGNGDGVLNAAELALGAGQVRVRALVTGADGRTLTLSTGALTRTGTVTAGVAGPLSLPLSDGLHSLASDVTDAAGNPNRRVAAPVISNPTALLDVTVDSGAPQIVWVTPTEGSSVRGAPLTLTVSSDAGQGRAVTLRVDGGVVCSPTLQANGQATCTSPLADGLHTFEAYVTDPAGNPGTAQVSATVDNTPPILTFTSPNSGDGFGVNPVPVTFTTTGLSAGRVITISSSSTPSSFTATVVAGGGASTSITLNNAAGQTLSATATDLAGNVGNATSGAFTVATLGCSLVFTTPPSNSVTYLVGDDQGAGAGLQTTVTLATDCPNGSAGSISVNAGAPQAGVVAGGNLVFSITIPDGSVSVPIVGQVVNGGGITTNAQYLATVDLVPPVFTARTPPGSFTLVAPGNPGINGTTVFGDNSAGLPATLDVSYTVTGAVGGTLDLRVNGLVVSSQPITLSPQTVAFPGTSFAQGTTQPFLAELRDLAGNLVTTGGNVTTDVLAPAAAPAPVLSLTDVRAATGSLAFDAPAGDAATGLTTSASYEIRWSFNPIPDAAAFLLATPVTAPAPAAPPTRQTATFSTTPLGTYNACVRAIDGVGNAGPLSCSSTGHGWAVSQYSGSALNTLYAFQVLFVGDAGSPIGGPLAGAQDGYGDFVVSEGAAAGNLGSLHLFYGGPDLANLSSITLTGSVSEQFGARSAVGDFDGDGLPDLLVGSSTFQSNRGRATILFGGPGGFSLSRKVELRNAPGMTSRFGRSLGNVGDFGSAAAVSVPDGIDDLFIGAYEEGVTGPGRGYVFFGRSRGAWTAAASACESAECFVPVSDAGGVGGRTFVGDANGDRFGFRNGAAVLGDLDGDGFDEFALPNSAVNKLALFDGAVVAGAQGVTLRPALNAMEVRTEAGALPGTLYDGFGTATVGGLDFTGDGYPDLIVANAFSSRSYVYPGDDATNSIGSVASQTLIDASGVGNVGFELVGADVSGDGKPDLLAGSNDSAGNLVVVLKNLGPGLAPFSSTNARLVGTGAFGIGLAAGDLDNDGHVEVLVGAPTDGNGKVIIYSP